MSILEIHCKQKRTWTWWVKPPIIKWVIIVLGLTNSQWAGHFKFYIDSLPSMDCTTTHPHFACNHLLLGYYWSSLPCPLLIISIMLSSCSPYMHMQNATHVQMHNILMQKMWNTWGRWQTSRAQACRWWGRGKQWVTTLVAAYQEKKALDRGGLREIMGVVEVGFKDDAWARQTRQTDCWDGTSG
jgi:hypothetical protein